jgi:hypothetical protein
MNSTPSTFIQIFGQQLADNKTISKIEIPIIQRDFAQGRETKEVNRIREQFINVLYKSLTGTSEDAVQLDFVYGNIEDGKLIPLDGQQRLTTLFLLHWYIAKHEEIEESEYSFLNNFTYKTRFSSQHFCESLVQSTPDFSKETISQWIIDQNWFMYSWEKDPTVNSMLVMLDKIHSTFKNQFELWDKLIEIENPPISFYFLPLEDMGLTDNLYIKMNSRGKPLTEFEHFKAEFEKIIKAVSADLYDEFIKKVDVDWVDMLWKYRGDDNLIDDEFMRYYRFVTEMICYDQSISIVDNDFDLANSVYGLENEKAIDNLKFLFNAFDCWKNLENIADFFDMIFSKTEFEKDKVLLYSDTTDLFLLCCNFYGEVVNGRRQFSFNNTLLLFGILQYLINKEQISNEQFIERIRIIRNLVNNSQDEIRETRLQALINDTWSVMVNGEVLINTMGFNEIQKTQEIEKMAWRNDNNELVEELNKLEDHFLLQGNISIIGLEDTENFELLATNFKKLFDDKQISYRDISRALLTINDYSQLASWRYLFGNTNDSSWRELFTISRNVKGFEKTKETLNLLLKTITGDYSNYLSELVSSYLNTSHHLLDWRYYFIKYPRMREGNSGVYYWLNDPSRIRENQYEVIMMNTAYSTSGKHWNPFLYEIFHNDDFSGQLSLEDYNAPLIINKTGEKIRLSNLGWNISNSNDEPIDTINIEQENGVDIEDRILVLKTYLTTIFN